MKKTLLGFAVTLCGISSPAFSGVLQDVGFSLNQDNVPVIRGVSAVRDSGSASKLQDEGLCPENITPFMCLAHIFNRGTTPSQKELTGWFAGRRFDEDNKIYGALLVGQEFNRVPSGGPIFGRVFKLVRVDSYDIGYFQSMGDAVLSDVYNIIGDAMDYTAAEFTPEGVTFKESYKDDADITTDHVVRKFGGYLIDKATTVNVKENKAKTIFRYYFQNVTPEK